MVRASTIAPQALQVDMSIATLKDLSIANLLWSLALESPIKRCKVVFSFGGIGFSAIAPPLHGANVSGKDSISRASRLPAKRFELFRWKSAKVNIDYHVEFDGHYYSVPHTLVRTTVEL